jgi:cytochrome c biogenesis protein CcmG/thiol:disulfide interchange protein DsbE
MKGVRLILWLPLVAFLAFVVVVASGLVKPDDTTHPSRLVGQPLPAFALPPSQPGKPGLSSADLKDGKPHLVNIFASWCVPCAAEAPQLDQLAQAGVHIVGIAIRDRPEDTADFLGKYGDPYERLGQDTQSRVQLALGSSGVPETFIVDGKGIIRQQHIGDIRPEELPAILSAVQAAR